MTSLSSSHSGFLVCFFRHYLPDKNLLPCSEYVCVSHGLRQRTSFATGVSHDQGHVTQTGEGLEEANCRLFCSMNVNCFLDFYPQQVLRKVT